MLQRVSDARVLAELTRRLERLTADQPRRWGRMSAHQMVFHLAEVAEAALGHREFPIPKRTPQPVVKFIALYLPLPWPKNLRTGADFGSRQLSPQGFPADLRRSIATLSELAAAGPARLAPRHPIFGAMTGPEWHRWAFLHTDHHLRQFGL